MQPQERENFEESRTTTTTNLRQYPITTAPILTPTTVTPTVVERIEKPVVIHDKILPSQLTEVQPIIHRDIEKTEVREVVQPMKERDIAPTQIQHVELPAQRFEARASDAAFQAQYREATSRIKGDTITAPLVVENIEKPAMVEEVIHKKLVEEVQPVLYREVLKPTVIEATKPIYEHVVEAPVMYEQVRPMVDLGTKVLPGGTQQTMGLQAQQTMSLPTQQTMSLPAQTYPTTATTWAGEQPKVLIKEKTTVLEPIGGEGQNVMGQQASGQQVPLQPVIR
jgi:hypothetical protein